MNQYEYRDPTRFTFTEYVDQTTLNPIAVGILIAIVSLFFFVERRYWFFLAALLVCTTGPAQRIVLAGLDFPFMRIIGLVGIGIAYMRGEFKSFTWSRLDTLVIGFALVYSLMAAVRGQANTVVMTLGQGTDAVSIYLLGRVAVKNLEDLYAVAKSLALLAIPFAVFLVIEKMTSRNFFSVMGGLPEFTAERAGKLRAQGAFAHPVIAGCWFAAAVPLIAVLFKTAKSGGMNILIAVTGIILSVASVIATASSTPIASLLAGIFGLCIYSLRSHVRMAFKVGVVLALIMHFVSEYGFHHLLYTRFSFVTGSTGYFRYRLVDAAIEQFPSWFLFGSNGTYHWGWGLDDVTHEFILAGVKGGLLGILTLIAILATSFRQVGVLVRSARPELSWAGFCIGVSIFTHIASFNGTSYFGQGIFIFYFTLGALQSLAAGSILEAKAAMPGVKPASGSRRSPAKLQRIRPA
ncbi:hypothetical protein OAL71_01505 [Phycisphaerales bacterium]|nr:hypothetical protein [Phycisphaerales bacterium]